MAILMGVTLLILALDLVPIFGSYGMLVFLKHGQDFNRGDFPKDPGMEGNVYGSGIDTRMGDGPH